MTLLLIKPYEKPTTILIAVIYDLSEIELPSESDLPLVKDIDLPHLIIIDEICNAYTEDEIVQTIIKTKLGSFQKIPHNITKNQFKLELGNCQIIDNLLYIKNRLYILLSKENTLYTWIIKKVHIFLLGG